MKQTTGCLEKKGIFTKKSSVTYYLGVVVKAEIMDEYDADLKAELEKKNRGQS